MTGSRELWTHVQFVVGTFKIAYHLRSIVCQFNPFEVIIGYCYYVSGTMENALFEDMLEHLEFVQPRNGHMAKGFWHRVNLCQQ